ncbi:MAG: carbohydrate-binding domain-containing protein [Lachnospirales bacterium]
MKKNKRNYMIAALATIGVAGFTGGMYYSSMPAGESLEASTSTVDESVATAIITFSDDTVDVEGDNVTVDSNNVATISSGGTYIIRGTSSNGQVYVNALEQDVELVFDNVSLSNSTSAPIFIYEAKDTTITLADGSINTFSDVASEVELDDTNEREENATIFSKQDLVIRGNGSLVVEGNYKNGITSKDDLTILGGDFTVTAANNGIIGKDSISISDGTFDIVAGGDGFQSDNTTDVDKGYIVVDGGQFNIDAVHDGLQAENLLTINDGEFYVITNGGSENAPVVESEFGGGMQGGRMDQNFDTLLEDTESLDALTDAVVNSTEISDEIKASFSDGEVTSDDLSSLMQIGRDLPDDIRSLLFANSGMGGGMQGGRMDQNFDTLLEDTESLDALTNAVVNSTEISDEIKASFSDGEVTSDDLSSLSQLGPNMPQEIRELLMSNMGTPEMTAPTEAQGTETTETTEEETVSDSHKGFKAANLVINNGTFEFDTYEDSIHANDTVVIENGTFSISSGDDAVHGDNYLTINGGTINVATSYEGLEANSITINDGDIAVVSTDDAVNASDANSTSSMPQMGQGSSYTEGDPIITINGGTLSLSSNSDGLDSNSALYINGGDIFIDGPTNNVENAVDFDNGLAVINGGTLVAVGGISGTFDETSTQNTFTYQFDTTQEANQSVTITDSSGSEILTITPEKQYTTITMSSSLLLSGETYELTTATSTGTITLSETDAYTSNATSGMMGGGGRGNMTPPGTAEGTTPPEMPQQGTVGTTGTTPPEIPQGIEGTTPPEMPPQGIEGTTSATPSENATN